MTMVLVRKVPVYLCNYYMEIDALNLCAALCKYGYDAEVRTVRSDWPETRIHTAYSSFTFSIWLKDSTQYEAAREFKRGLYAAVSVSGPPDSFAEGVLAGATLRGLDRSGQKPKISGGRARLPMLGSGS
jgi:hypothetical protein